MDEAQAEKTRKELLELKAKSAAVESTGQAKAEATSRAEAMKIEAEAAVEAARLKAQASKIEADSELERLTAARNAELTFLADQFTLENTKAKEMAGKTSAPICHGHFSLQKHLYLLNLFELFLHCRGRNSEVPGDGGGHRA